MLDDTRQKMDNGRIATLYPPPPWHMLGQCWGGLFHAAQPLALPAGLHHVLPACWLVVGLVRYREGTLRYDEFFTASAARAGLRMGLFIHNIWVNDADSQAGGRSIWGLPKELATFTWHRNGVRISDAEGVIAALTINQHPRALPPLPMWGAGIGHARGAPVFFDITLWGCLGRAAMRIDSWSDHFPARIHASPLFSAAMNPFRATFHSPWISTVPDQS